MKEHTHQLNNLPEQAAHTVLINVDIFNLSQSNHNTDLSANCSGKGDK